MNTFELQQGTLPLVLAMPHTGTFVPDDILTDLNDEGRTLRDTDWHIHQLYQDLVPGASTVRAFFHRYVIDANRDPEGRSLYPGQNTTGLCPTINFDNAPIYKEGREPDEQEINRRKSEFHTPYHQALNEELQRVRGEHGIAVLYDCHSIRSNIPHLFEGTLPDFNIGTNEGTTCDPSMQEAVHGICSNASGYSSILNGRFKGGWTTRHYGRPDQNIHAIQMELSQSSHLATEELPFDYSSQKASILRPHLKNILEELTRLAFELARKG